MSHEAIINYAKIMKCSYIANYAKDFFIEVAAEQMSTEEAFECALKRESELRRKNGIRRRKKGASFPYQMTFDTFVQTHLSAPIRREIKILETLSFIDEGSNVILIGNPGVGKTALAIALGNKACEQVKTVSFISIPNLVLGIKEAMSLNELTLYKRRFEKVDLVILDDLGYCSFDTNCGEVLFNLLSNRAQKGGSMIVTTNLTFDRWKEIFKDEVLTGAIVDRIAHKAHIVDMTGDSYRVMETKQWLSEKKE